MYQRTSTWACCCPRAAATAKPLRSDAPPKATTLTRSQQYRLALDAHWKKPLYSTNVGLIYRNIGSAYLQLQDGPGALRAYQDCLKYAAPRWHTLMTDHRHEPGHEGCKDMVRRIRESYGL